MMIYNPNAAHGRTKKILPGVEAQIKEKGINYDLHVTGSAEQAISIVKEADFGKYDGIITAGGDGTLFAIVNGYFANPSKKRIPLGILPIGTGNAFARDLDLHVDRWPEALDIIAQNKTRFVDVGLFKTGDKTYHYLNIMGLGFVADVGETASRLKGLGNIAYTYGVLYRTLFLKTHHLTIELDGKTLERENLFVEISNTRYTANFLMAPNARIDDGLLDVTLLGKMSRRRLLKSFPKIFTGEHIHLPEVEQFQSRSIRIKTDIPKILTPDGELLGTTPVEVECLHKAIEVFWK